MRLQQTIAVCSKPQAYAASLRHNPMQVVAYMKEKQEKTGVKVLWGTANLFSHRVYKVCF
jgi:xylose isomerase